MTEEDARDARRGRCADAGDARPVPHPDRARRVAGDLPRRPVARAAAADRRPRRSRRSSTPGRASASMPGSTRERPWFTLRRRPCASRWPASSARVRSRSRLLNSLTVDIHLLLASFFRPAGRRRRILADGPLFPSDRHALTSHLAAARARSRGGPRRHRAARRRGDSSGPSDLEAAIARARPRPRARLPGRRQLRDRAGARHRAAHRGRPRRGRGRRLGPGPRRGQHRALAPRLGRRLRRVVHVQVPQRRTGLGRRDLRPRAPRPRPVASRGSAAGGGSTRTSASTRSGRSSRPREPPAGRPRPPRSSRSRRSPPRWRSSTRSGCPRSAARSVALTGVPRGVAWRTSPIEIVTPRDPAARGAQLSLRARRRRGAPRPPRRARGRRRLPRAGPHPRRPDAALQRPYRRGPASFAGDPRATCSAPAVSRSARAAAAGSARRSGRWPPPGRCPGSGRPGGRSRSRCRSRSARRARPGPTTTSQRRWATSSTPLASRSISRGSSTPIFCSPDSARAAQTFVSSIARARSVSKLTFISIIRSSVPGSRPAFAAPSTSGRQEGLGVQLRALAGGADEAVADPPGEARRGRPGGRDVDRDGLVGPVVDRRVVGPVVLALEADELLAEQLLDQRHRLLEPGEPLRLLRPRRRRPGSR